MIDQLFLLFAGTLKWESTGRGNKQTIFKIQCFKVQLLTASEPRLTKLKWIIK